MAVDDARREVDPSPGPSGPRRLEVLSLLLALAGVALASYL